MNNTLNDQIALKLVDICFDNMLQIFCKSLIHHRIHVYDFCWLQWHLKR